MGTEADTVEADTGALTAQEQQFFDSEGQVDPAGQADAGQADRQQPNEGDKPAGNQEGDKPNGKFVPLEALHEERTKRKDIDRRFREVEIENARFRERFAILEKAQQVAPTAPPDPETDFIGAVKHQNETLTQLQKRLEQRDAADQEAHQRGELVRNYAAAASDFERATPDFKPAYAHLLQSRAAELAELGYSPGEIQQAIQNEELQIATVAFQKGKNPGEIIYNLAKQRGYVKKDDKAAADAAAAKLDAQERGQQANKSLSNTGGSNGDVEMTAERLLAMPLNEFEAWIDKNPAKAKRLMGA